MKTCSLVIPCLMSLLLATASAQNFPATTVPTATAPTATAPTATAPTASAPATPPLVSIEALQAQAVKDLEAFTKSFDNKTLTLEGEVRYTNEIHVFIVPFGQPAFNGDGIYCSFTQEIPADLATIKMLKPGDRVRFTGELLLAVVEFGSAELQFFMCENIKHLPAPATATSPATTSRPATTSKPAK